MDTDCSEACAAGSYATKTTLPQGCVDCEAGSQWDNDNSSATPCVACKACRAEQVQTAVCTRTSDTDCGGCAHGEYADKSNPAAQKCVACMENTVDSDRNAGTPCILLGVA